MSDDHGLDRLPLSPMQEGMVYHHLSGGAADVDLQQIVLDLPEAVDTARLRESWQRIVQRYPTLRSSIEWENRDTPIRVVHGEVEVVLAVDDLTGRPSSEWESAIRAPVYEERARGFDPSQAPLFRLRLIRLAHESYRLIWSFHHLVMDGRSAAIVLGELFEVYEALGAGREPELAAPIDYRRYLSWLGGRDTGGDQAYWRTRLAGFESATSLPGERRGVSGPVEPGTPLAQAESTFSDEQTRRVQDFAATVGVTVNAIVQAAWSIILSRFSGESDVLYGVTRAVRRPELEGSERLVGVLIQTYPVRVAIDRDCPVDDWLRGLRQIHSDMNDRYLTDLPLLQSCSGVRPGSHLFQSLYMYDHEEMTTSLRRRGGAWALRSVRILERPPYPLALYAYGEPRLRLRLVADPGEIEDEMPGRLLEHLKHVIQELTADQRRPVREAMTLPAAEKKRLVEMGDGIRLPLDQTRRVHEQVLALADESGDREALVCGTRTVTLKELASSVRAQAAGLRARGVGEGTLVGLEGARTIETVTALLAILEAGGAYLPLDPAYPEDRLRFMAEDSGASLVVRGPGARISWGATLESVTCRELSEAGSRPTQVVRSVADVARSVGEPGSHGLAYVIYTSGSTGRPKGVVVTHRNVENFLEAMDQAVAAGEPGTWLSVTPFSFDISVLEILWTLSRGWRVALPDPPQPPTPGADIHTASTDGAERIPLASAFHETGEITGPAGTRGAANEMEFGLFYFAAACADEAQESYRLLLDGARKADTEGFASVWTPERHFHEFGGLYPNPSVTGAALAAITRNVSIRGGSVVLPLHDPIRVAEEWSVVDNLSRGRAGIAFASGWQRNDFVLAPECYEDRHEAMFRGIELVQRLWRGEEVAVPGVGGDPVSVRLYPRPIQPSLPIWLTAAGSPETFRRAGEIGAGVLTHLLGQSVADLGQLVSTYREGWTQAGHGPGQGHVTVMLHTYIGEDEAEVRELVRPLLRDYLRSSVSLMKNYSGVWSSRKGAPGAPVDGHEFEDLSPGDLEAILDGAFDRYYETSGLLGPVEKCAHLVGQLREVGIDEVACLIDFGVETDRALAGIDEIVALRAALGAGSRKAVGTTSPADSLPSLAARSSSAPPRPGDGLMDVADLIRRHSVTHMQCTPSLARMLVVDEAGRRALSSLDTLLIGGEAFPAELARELCTPGGPRVLNMYGPTETTVWSSSGSVRGDEKGVVSIGRPVANTHIYVLDETGSLLPHGAAGEVYIGGEGVTSGYLGRPSLTAERFVPDPFREGSVGCLYRTGDRARWRPDGTLEFLGRMDQQVKLRGHRVELGEIEVVLQEHPRISEVAVVVKGEGEGRLAAYFTTAGAEPPDSVLADWLRERLPNVMVPSEWVCLNELPLTPNGKVDRGALPDTESRTVPLRSDAGIAAALTSIWAEVLGMADVTRDDDFFALGGNSLSTIQVAFRIRKQFGIELPLRTFFSAPTVSLLAVRIEEELLSQADTGELERLVTEMESLSDEEIARIGDAR